MEGPAQLPTAREESVIVTWRGEDDAAFHPSIEDVIERAGIGDTQWTSDERPPQEVEVERSGVSMAAKMSNVKT